MKKIDIINATQKALNDLWEVVRGLHKDIHDTQGDIPATVELEKLEGDDYWHFL